MTGKGIKEEIKEEITERIKRAEAKAGVVSAGRYRLHFHLMPPVGWMNDPNGLCFYKGCYHVFFQYSPEDAEGGQKYWGHYASKDLINWEYQGVPLVTDTEWDRDGVYSGSAFTEDGSLEVFYTGNVREAGDFDYISAGRQSNVIRAVSEDGREFGEKELLLSNADYPASYTCHVRDPKVFCENGLYYMVLGGRKNKDQGAVMLYVSEDKRRWSLLKELDADNPFGYMWECPDLFMLEGKRYLLCCPQGLEEEPERWQNLYQAGYFLCKDFDLEKGNYECLTENFRELDAGFDFYAPQTFTDENGRHILIGWAGIPEEESYGNKQTVEEGWQHSMTVPRELTTDGEGLVQYPVRELYKLRKERLTPDEQGCIFGEAFDMEITFAIKKGEDQAVRLAEDLVLSCGDGLVTLTFLNETGAGRTRRCARLPEGEKKIESMRILKDTSLVEIYINGGKLVFTTRYYPECTEQTRLRVDGEVKEMQIWKLA